MYRDDVRTKRSYSEKSGSALRFFEKSLPGGVDLESIAIPFDDVADIVDDAIRRPPQDDDNVIKWPHLKDYFYQRLIGGEWHTKLMTGYIGNKLD
ncbi:hypothetical protein RZS08_31185, partial [Arthrospira platensis SPKY1]|nr:hypothetical protein [Arthrospira platensis SPKY1]